MGTSSWTWPGTPASGGGASPPPPWQTAWAPASPRAGRMTAASARRCSPPAAARPCRSHTRAHSRTRSRGAPPPPGGPPGIPVNLDKPCETL
eukprot:1006249-Pyramimonas_sp.AAC.1